MGSNGTRLQRWMARGAAGLCALGMAAMLAACGGSTGAIEPFKPTRLIVLGDELSLLLPDGRKHTVNALVAGTTDIDCATYPLWVQAVGNAFSLTFAECNPNKVATAAQMYAKAGAKAADVVAQLEKASAAGALGQKQLATVYFGLNDILELYAQYPARTQDSLKAEIRARGVALGDQVNRIARSGPAVLLVTAPDLGLAPFGVAQTAAFPELATSPTRARFLSDLTDSFNAGLRVTIINDGRLIGLVSSDQMVRDIQAPFTSFYGFTDLATALCPATALPPACTTGDVVTGGDALTWGYATDKLFSPGLQSRLGQIAASRALRNPF